MANSDDAKAKINAMKEMIQKQKEAKNAEK